MSDTPALHLHHGCISVSNLDRSIEFYSRVLGFQQESRRRLPNGILEFAFLVQGDSRLELVCHSHARPLPEFARDRKTDFQVIGTKHLSFGADDAHKLHTFLAEQRVRGLTEVFDNNPSYYYFFFRDPDDIWLEIIAPKL